MKMIAFSLVLALTAAVAGAQTVRWSPAVLATTEGTGNLSMPFWSRAATYQQVHDYEHARATLGAARTITGIAFRKDAVVPWPLVKRTLEVQIVVGSTTRDSTTASKTFAANLGSKPQIALPWTKIDLPARANVASPNPTGWVVPWATPYQFASKPGMGLCWEWRHRNATHFAQGDSALDAHFTSFGVWRGNEGQGCQAQGQPRPARISPALLDYGARTYDTSLIFARRDAPAVFVLGGKRATLQLPGMCAPLRTQPLVTVTGRTDANGRWRVLFRNLGLRGQGGFSLFGQFLWADPTFGFGIGLSDMSNIELHDVAERGCARIYDSARANGGDHRSTTAAAIEAGIVLVTGFVVK